MSLMFWVCRSAINRTKDASNPYQISFQVAGSEVSGHVHHFRPVCCVCDSECLCMSIPNEVIASCVADIGQLTCTLQWPFLCGGIYKRISSIPTGADVMANI